MTAAPSAAAACELSQNAGDVVNAFEKRCAGLTRCCERFARSKGQSMLVEGV